MVTIKWTLLKYSNVYTRIAGTALDTNFTRGAGQIWLDNVECHGSETRLIDCPADPLGRHTCTHEEDAGVSCISGNNINLLFLLLLTRGG